MNLINRIKNKFKYEFLRLVKPEIIGGFKNSNGKSFSTTMISNLTHISQKGDNLFIGNNVFIGHYNYIDGYNAKLVISDNVQITNFVSVLTHSSHHSIRLFSPGMFSAIDYPEVFNVGEVFIGENTYIGAHSVVMPGSKIGKGCIISAFSYVKGDFPDFSIIRGVPARIIGSTKEIDAGFLERYPEFNKTYFF